MRRSRSSAALRRCLALGAAAAQRRAGKRSPLRGQARRRATTGADDRRAHATFVGLDAGGRRRRSACRCASTCYQRAHGPRALQARSRCPSSGVWQKSDPADQRGFVFTKRVDGARRARRLPRRRQLPLARRRTGRSRARRRGRTPRLQAARPAPGPRARDARRRRAPRGRQPDRRLRVVDRATPGRRDAGAVRRDADRRRRRAADPSTLGPASPPARRPIVDAHRRRAARRAPTITVRRSTPTDAVDECERGRQRRARAALPAGAARCVRRIDRRRRYTGWIMKTEIHPEYVEAHVRCTCGNEFTTRSTQAEIHVEICSNCHPFYTGKQKLVDTGGRVERFQRRAAKRRRGRALGPARALRRRERALPRRRR